MLRGASEPKSLPGACVCVREEGRRENVGWWWRPEGGVGGDYWQWAGEKEATPVSFSFCQRNLGSFSLSSTKSRTSSSASSPLPPWTFQVRGRSLPRRPLLLQNTTLNISDAERGERQRCPRLGGGSETPVISPLSGEN